MSVNLYPVLCTDENIKSVSDNLSSVKRVMAIAEGLCFLRVIDVHTRDILLTELAVLEAVLQDGRSSLIKERGNDLSNDEEKPF